MKRNFLNSTGRVVLVAAFLLGLFLPSGARAEGNGQTLAQIPEQRRDHSVWLRIMAFADAPVVGADVRVTVHGQLLADARAATNRQGVFPLHIWRAWLLGEEARGANRRSFVRISISGGTINGDRFPGHLTADVALTDPVHQILVVNPVSTLVSRVLDERPELKLDGAEALVRRFLKLPANYSLGLALRQSSGYASPFFSPVAFMTQARDGGGLDALEHLLLQELASPSATHSFRNTKALGSEESSLAEDLAKAALKYTGNQLAGWVMTQTGLATPDATQAGIAALQQSLADLQSSVDALSTQVAQLTQIVKSTATENLYNTITTAAQPIAVRVTTYETNISYFASVCPPAPESPVPPEPNPNQEWCDTWWPTYLNEMEYSYQNTDYETLESYIKDNGTLDTAGMLHLYSLWLGQSKPFFRPADSTKMQNLYDYWDGVLTSAANLRMELFHQAGDQNTPAGEQQIITFIGNPDAVPPTAGVFQADRAANLKLMFPPLSVDTQTGGTTVISTQDHTMWSLVPWVHNWPPAGYPPTWSPQAACQFFNQIPIYVNSIPTEPSNGISSYPYAGFYNWQYAPSKAQWQAAVSLAPTNGSVQWGDWLTQQTQTTETEMPPSAGFFNWNRHCSGGNGTWTSTQTTPPSVWNINLVTNSFQNWTANGPWYPARTLAAGEQYFWYQ